MLRELGAERFERGGIGFAFERDEHADLAEVRRNRVVHIRDDEALIDRDGLHPADLLVFTDGRDVVGQLVADRAAIGVIHGLERFDVVAVRAQRDLRRLAHEVLELVVLGDEVGFRVDLDRDTLGAFDGDADQPFRCGTAGLLLGGGETLGTQRVDRGFDVAIGGFESLLRIHHARAGLLAEFLYVSGGKSGHRSYP